MVGTSLRLISRCYVSYTWWFVSALSSAAARGGVNSAKIAARCAPSAQHLLFVSPFLFIPVYASMPSSCVSSYCAYVEISSLLSFVLCPGSDSDRSIDGSQCSGTWFGGDISLAPIWTPPESTGFLFWWTHIMSFIFVTVLPDYLVTALLLPHRWIQDCVCYNAPGR